MSYADRPGIRIIGPAGLVALFLASAADLTAAGIFGMSIAAGLALYALRCAGGTTTPLRRIIPPFLFLYCAVRLDPSTGVLLHDDAHTLSIYRWILLGCLAAGWLSFRLVKHRIKEGSAHTEPIIHWVAGTGLFGLLFYIAVAAVSTAEDGSAASTLTVSALLIAYVLLFIVIERAARDEVTCRWFIRAIIGVFVVAAVSGGIRVGMFRHYYSQAQSMLAMKETAQARMILDRAYLAGEGLDAASLMALSTAATGRADYIEGNYNGALASAEAALSLDAECFDAYELRGMAFIKKRKWLKASDAFETAYRLKPRESRIYNFLALVFAKTRQFDKGTFLGDYEGSLIDGLEGSGNIIILAKGLNIWGRYGEALELADREIVSGNDSYFAYTQKAASLEALGDASGAERWYKHAIEASPGEAIAAYGRLESLYARSGRMSDAALMRERGLDTEDTSVHLEEFRTTSYVGWKSGFMAFNIDGMATGPVKLYPGDFVLSVTARGESAAGEYPICRVMLDSKLIAEFAVDSAQWEVYGATFKVDEAAIYGLKIIYINDRFLPGEDRNLYVRDVAIDRVSHAK